MNGEQNGAVELGAADAPLKYDALVVGSGIGGMESALKLGDMGYRVLVIEKDSRRTPASAAR